MHSYQSTYSTDITEYYRGNYRYQANRFSFTCVEKDIDDKKTGKVKYVSNQSKFEAEIDLATADVQGGPDFHFKFLKRKNRDQVVTALPSRYDEVEDPVIYEPSESTVTPTPTPPPPKPKTPSPKVVKPKPKPAVVKVKGHSVAYTLTNLLRTIAIDEANVSIFHLCHFMY
jgi:hypothetical protein